MPLLVMIVNSPVPTVPVKDPDPAILYDWDAVVRMLCAAKPADAKFQKQAYHALTAGFILGEVVRRASKRDPEHRHVVPVLEHRDLRQGKEAEHRERGSIGYADEDGGTHTPNYKELF